MADSSIASPQNPNPQPENSNPQPEKPNSQPDSTPQPLNPNPNSAPPLFSPPPINNPYGAPPPPATTSFRPISTNQFSPIQPNPNFGMAPPMVPGQMYQVPPGQLPNALRPPFMMMPNGYMANTVPPPGIPRYFAPTARPPFQLRPPVPVGAVMRPPMLGMRPPVNPVVRPPIPPIVTPAEKPQTTVYVGKIAPTVENEFIRSLLELCGPVKSWKRAQDPSDGTPRGFGFCEFESAEGVLRALRLLSKFNVDGQELVLNVNQATREYLERFVEKKKEDIKKQKETEIEEAKKEGENAPTVDKNEGNEKNEPPKSSVEESKNDEDDSGKKENDSASFGLVTDEDRESDREALEKLTNMIEERLKTKPLPPPPAQKVVDGTTNSNSEVPAKSGDKDSDVDNIRKEEKNDDETTSGTKPLSRAGTESPDRSRRYDSSRRERDRERDLKREKERELERLERERERERARRERERELEIQKAERFYKERVKDWEVREKDKEYQLKHEKEKEKERERERRRLIAEQEDENDDDSRKRRRRSEIEEKRKRRRREKEEDLADRLKEEEEIVEAEKKAEEERQRPQERDALQSDAPVANGDRRSVSPEAASNEINKGAEQTYDRDSAHVNHIGDGAAENGATDETITTTGSMSDARSNNNVAAKKLGFGLSGSGKRTAVPSVFNQEEDEDTQKEKKMRPLVPLDYSTEELQTGSTPPNLAAAAAAEFAKRISNNSKEEKSDFDMEKGRRSHGRSSHRDQDRDRDDNETGRARDDNRRKSLDKDRDREHGSEKPKHSEDKKVLDAKQLIDTIPKTKDELFSYEINWEVYDKHELHERMRPWISKKIAEFLGEEEESFVDYIISSFRNHVKAAQMLELLQSILDEEAEMFVLKMWRMLIFEIKKVETGLASRPKA